MSAEQAAQAIRARWPRLRVTVGAMSTVAVEGTGWRVALWRAYSLPLAAEVLGWGSEVRMELNDDRCEGGCQCTAWSEDPCEAVALAVAAVAKVLRAVLARVDAEMVTAADGGGV